MNTLQATAPGLRGPGLTDQDLVALDGKVATAGVYANSAAASANLAAAAAETAPNVYPTIAAGVAATADGKSFWAQSAAGFPTLYRRNGTKAGPIGSIFASGGLPLSSFGAIPDAKSIPAATVTAGSTTLVSTTPRFTADDVGKLIIVARAALNGAKLVTTIQSVQSATTITMADPAVISSVRGASVGTDCGPALQAALTQIGTMGGGELVIDGLFLLHSPVVANFGTTAAHFTMSAYGNGGLIVATGISEDALILTGSNRIIIDGVTVLGTLGETIDSRRAISILGTSATIKNCTLFAVSCIGADDGAVVFTDGVNLVLDDNAFGSCVGGLGNPTVMLRNFAGFRSRGNQFFDYGRYNGDLFIKTGDSFTKAWIFGENQFGEGEGAAVSSTFRSVDDKFDEGCIFAIALTTDFETGKRISHARISGMQANQSFSDGASAIYLENVGNAVVEQPSIGWCNKPQTSLTVINCGTVEVIGAAISPGAPGTPLGVADGIRAVDVDSLTLRDSDDYKRFNFTRVAQFQQITTAQGGVVPFKKSGRVTDQDFAVAPVTGTFAFDQANNRIYVKSGSGWVAGPVMVPSTDATFALSNVTPATGTLTGANHYAKTSGDTAWGNCTANVAGTLLHGFRLRVSFPGTDAATYVRLGVVPAAYGDDAVTNFGDLRIGILQDTGTSIYMVHNGDIIAGPFPYAAGQVVELDYNDTAGNVTLKVNGTTQVDAMAAPVDLTPDLQLRFTSTLYNVGAAFDLLGFDPY